MDSLTIQSKVVGPVRNPNCKFTFVQVVKLLILFPFFSVKNAADYANSGLGKLFSCKKDMFYRLMDDWRIDWRRLIYSIKANYAGMDVMLFFYRKGNGSWNALISTDTGIDAKRLSDFTPEDGLLKWLIRR